MRTILYKDHFYQYVQEISGFVPNFDILANNWNAKCCQLNSLAFCVGSNGVNAINYPWGGKAKNWLFPPPRLIIPTILHLQKSFATGLLLKPHWKNAVFFPFVMEFSNQPVLKNRWVIPASCFGTDFVGKVDLLLFDFNIVSV
jgi:hypothetical protein